MSTISSPGAWLRARIRAAPEKWRCEFNRYFAGAEVDAVRVIEDNGAPVERGFSLAEDINRLGAEIEELGDVALIIIDPLTAYLGDDVDSGKTADVRALLRPLGEMATHYDGATIGVTHLRKNTDGNAVLLVTGSLAAARAAFFVMRDEAATERPLFLSAKNNLGLDNVDHAYRIESVVLPEGIATSRIAREPGTIAATVDD
jgi:putative DNA primase/helicase